MSKGKKEIISQNKYLDHVNDFRTGVKTFSEPKYEEPIAEAFPPVSMQAFQQISDRMNQSEKEASELLVQLTQGNISEFTGLDQKPVSKLTFLIAVATMGEDAKQCAKAMLTKKQRDAGRRKLGRVGALKKTLKVIGSYERLLSLMKGVEDLNDFNESDPPHPCALGEIEDERLNYIVRSSGADKSVGLKRLKEIFTEI